MKNNLPPRMRHKFKLRHQKGLVSKSADDDIELMANNLLKVQRQLTEEQNKNVDYIKDHLRDLSNPQQQAFKSNTKFVNQQKYKQENTSIFTSAQSYTKQQTPSSSNPQKHQNSKSHLDIIQSLKHIYQQYLSQNHFSQNYEQKINELLDNQDQIISIGNSIALFQMVYYFKEILTSQVLKEIQYKAFQTVLNFDESNEQQNDQKQSLSDQKQLIKLVNAELIAICGIPSQQIVEYYLREIIQIPKSFQTSFKVLVNMGIMGLSTLFKIINQDFDILSQNIINKLCKTHFVISKIIVPQIYADLESVTSSTKQKNNSLFLLTRIGELAYSQKLMDILFSLFKNNLIDKRLLIQAIISTGKQKGQKVLISLLKHSSLNEEIAVFIIQCLSKPSQTHKQMKLSIQLCQYSVVDLLKMSKLYFYQSRLGLFNSRKDKNKDVLFVNSRMLLSLVEKFINDQEQQSLETQNQNARQVTQQIESFTLSQIISVNGKQELPNLQIINLFLSLLQQKKQTLKIKIALISALGRITLPSDHSEVVQKLTPYLLSPDHDILAQVCLTLSMLKFSPSLKVILRVNQLLKHNLWKVRVSACQMIGCLLRQPNDKVLQTLIKCLKDGSINRQLVCQTLLKIHPVCEQLLIEIVKSSKDTKIQEIILCSFNEKSILQSQNFLYILETISEFSKHKKKQIRYICLGVVNSLRQISIKEEMNISQFKEKNILLFYFNFLSDSCAQIRDLALKLILEFGSYAELILIQGMTKGRVNCKIQCAKGLGLRGVQNFRALLLGMRDLNQKVRQQCSLSILQNFEVQQILDQFRDEGSLCISLLYNIKDLVESSNSLCQQIRMFLSELMRRLSQNISQLDLQVLDEDEQIQRQIEEFKKSMKLREQIKQNHSSRFKQQDSECTENINPNNFILKEKENFQNIQNNCLIDKKQKEVSNLKVTVNRNNKKMYYFRLNQSI